VEVIAAIGARLRDRDSPFAALFDALVGLSKAKPRQDWLGELLAEAPDDSLEALDREWEEAAAFSKPSAQAGCQGCATTKPGLHLKTL
jgi:nitrate reductase delta subunit